MLENTSEINLESRLNAPMNPKIIGPRGEQSRYFRGWNELKISGKLPERRSYHVGCMNNGVMYVFGGQDLKEGAVDTTWRLDVGEMSRSAAEGDHQIYVQWEQMNTSGK